MTQLELTPVKPQCSRTASETSGSDFGQAGEGHRRDDRRRGRLNTELLTAILNGSVDEVARRLGDGAFVDATCRRPRTTALQLAVVLGHLDIARLLLTRGAQPQRRDRAGRRAVHLAAAVGNPKLLALLLDADPTTLECPVGCASDTDFPRECLDSWAHDHDLVANKIPEIPKGATPLHIAAQRLHYECVAELLRRGGRVDIPDERGLTPLDVLAEESGPPSPPALVDLSADALPIPDSDDTLTRIENMRQRISGDPSRRGMHMRISLDPAEPAPRQMGRFISPPGQVVTTILPLPPKPGDSSVTITPPTPSRKPPSLAQRVANELISKGARMPSSKVIVKQGGGVSNQVKMSTTCLHTAVERNDCQLVDYLLDQGACQLTWNSKGLTALHLAVSKRLLEPLRTLLERDKSSKVVDSRDSLGRTPLQLAVAEEWFPGVSLLLEAGADVKVSCNSNETVLHIAARSSQPQLLEELLDIPESIKIIESRNSHHETPLFCAASASRLSCVRLLVDRGADVTASLPGDITLLHVAAERGDSAILAELLQNPRMADFKNVRSKENKGGTTALHLAALDGSLECVELLVAAGCDLFVVTTICPHFGSTALHLAAIRGHVKVVECIVKHNRATMCVKNVDGWYPLHVAARFAKEECVRSMLLNGANLAATVQDTGGYKKTAFDIIVYSIVHPVAFLEKIFDSCIEINDYPLNSAKCILKVNYDLLQPLGPQRKQLRVLDSLLNCGKHNVQEKLLLHPLVQTFLYLKWKKLRIFFFMMIVLYLIFTISLTTMAMFFYVLKAQSVAVDNCINGCRLALCSSLTFITLQEILQVTRMQRYYIKDLESWVKWSAFLLATVATVAPHPAPWLVHVSAIAVLLSWLELLFLLSRWPSSMGFYILMFFAVAKNVIRVLATFTFVILGFTFAFMIQFEAQTPFETWWESLVKVMVMALEFDYGDLFENIHGMDATSIVSRSMFLVFMVLVAIVLMNLLVGLAVSDIAALEKQGRAQRLAKQIDFLSMLEIFVYNTSVFACCPKKLSEAIKRCRASESYLLLEPGKPLRKTRQTLPQELRQDVISNVANRITHIEENTDENDGKNYQKALTETESISSSSVVKSEKQLENRTGTTPFDAQIKGTLEGIMKELAFIKHELEDIKMQRHGAVFHPPEDDPGARLLRT